MQSTSARRPSSRLPPGSPPSLATPLKNKLSLASPAPQATYGTTETKDQQTTTTTTPYNTRRRSSAVHLDFASSACSPLAPPSPIAAAASTIETKDAAVQATSPLSFPSSSSSSSSSYVLRIKTQDMDEALAAVNHARSLKRPLLLQGLLADAIKTFTPTHLLLLPEDVKVCSDDKSGIGFQSLRDWGVAPKRHRKATATAAAAAAAAATTAAGRKKAAASASATAAASASSSSSSSSTTRTHTSTTAASQEPIPANWGRIASIMSQKAPQARLWTRFMQGDMAAFREESGHTALAAFGESVFHSEPQSNNIIVTGNPTPSADGRCFELKSDVHQDQHDNLMLVTSGAKIWALAELSEEEVAKARKTKGRLTSSFRLDAVDRTRNKTVEEHEVAARFETVFMGPGDVLFNPAWVWHQVNSEPQTVAYSIMYPLEEVGVEEVEGKGKKEDKEGERAE